MKRILFFVPFFVGFFTGTANACESGRRECRLGTLHGTIENMENFLKHPYGPVGCEVLPLPNQEKHPRRDQASVVDYLVEVSCSFPGNLARNESQILERARKENLSLQMRKGAK